MGWGGGDLGARELGPQGRTVAQQPGGGRLPAWSPLFVPHRRCDSVSASVQGGNGVWGDLRQHEGSRGAAPRPLPRAQLRKALQPRCPAG